MDFKGGLVQIRVAEDRMVVKEVEGGLVRITVATGPVLTGCIEAIEVQFKGPDKAKVRS